MRVTDRRNWRWRLAKNLLTLKLDELGEARSSHIRTNALTGKNWTTVVHKGSLPFMVPELIIEELSIASARINELKTVDVWVVSMTFFTRLKPD